MTSFSDFALLAPLARALAGEGYTNPTPIQAQTIPQALTGRDILGIAQTGTGKTCAFAVPILQRLGKSGTTRRPRSCRALIISPTRELASQIADSFRAYGKHMHLSVDVVFGGIPISRQIKRLTTGADILVATPGRLLDLVQQKALTLADVEIFVLDEADQMFDLGFVVPIKRIHAMLPKKRQSLFFSATMPKAIAELADSFLNDPAKVAVTPVATTAERVVQGVIHVAPGAKQELLYQMLTEPEFVRTLVFTRTKHGADKVVKQLLRDGLEAAAIHGNKSQAQREKALAGFRAGTCSILVATDIAARGIDVEGVTHVINFDLPNVPEAYVHRIGRTARAGAAGMAISFCTREERGYLRDIEKTTRQPIPVLPLPDGIAVEPAEIRVVEPREGQHRQGQPSRHGQHQNGQPRNGQPRNHGQTRNGSPRNGAAPQRGAQPEARGEARPDSRPNNRNRQGGGRPGGPQGKAMATSR